MQQKQPQMNPWAGGDNARHSQPEEPQPQYHRRQRSPYRREEERYREEQRQMSHPPRQMTPPAEYGRAYSRSPQRDQNRFESTRSRTRSPGHQQRFEHREQPRPSRSPPPEYRNYLERAYFQRQKSRSPERMRAPSQDYDPTSPTRSPNRDTSRMTQSELEQHWRDEMSRMQSAANRGQRELDVVDPKRPSPPPQQNAWEGGRFGRNAEDDIIEQERERLAAEEARLEVERLMAAKRQQRPQVIDLADSDEEDDKRKVTVGPGRRMPPPPPMLSQEVNLRQGPITPPPRQDPWADFARRDAAPPNDPWSKLPGNKESVPAGQTPWSGPPQPSTRDPRQSKWQGQRF